MLVPTVVLPPGMQVGDVPISHKAANKCLKEHRTRMSDTEGKVRQSETDLTNGPFDWKCYLTHHPQSEELIGAGVCKFEVRFLNSWDHNMGQPRCDFVVHRADGTAARLHPSKNGPGKIVTGMLDDWLCIGPTRPLCMERNRGATEHNAEQFRNLHQVDTISMKKAAEFLRVNVEGWEAKQHPRGPFFVNLMENTSAHTNDHFRWTHLLNSTPWGRDIVLDVDAFFLVWFVQKERPGFWFHCRNGECGTVDPLCHGQCIPKWNEKADEISWR